MFKKFFTTLLLTFTLLNPILVSAHTPPEIADFPSFYEVKMPTIQLPTVVKIQLPDDTKYQRAKVFDAQNSGVETQLEQVTQTQPKEFSINSDPKPTGDVANMLDKNPKTFASYDLESSSADQKLLVGIDFYKKITANSITFS
jgi:hypothetical protein